MFVSPAVVVSFQTLCQNVIVKPLFSLFNYICSFFKDESIILPTISFVVPLAITLLVFYPWISQQQLCDYITMNILSTSTCNDLGAAKVACAIYFTILTSMFQQIVLKQSSIAYKHFFNNFRLTQDQSILFQSSLIIHVFIDKNNCNMKKWCMIWDFICVVVIVIETFFYPFISNCDHQSFILYLIFVCIQISCFYNLFIKFCFFGEIMIACKLYQFLLDRGKFQEWFKSLDLDLTQTQRNMIDNMHQNPPYFIMIPIEWCQHCFDSIMDLEFVNIRNYIKNKLKSFLYQMFVKSNYTLKCVEKFFVKIDHFMFIFVDSIRKHWIYAVKHHKKLHITFHFVCIYLSFWFYGAFILTLSGYVSSLCDIHNLNATIFIHCKCVAVGRLSWTTMVINYYVEGHLMFFVYAMCVYCCLVITFAVATICTNFAVDSEQISNVVCIGCLLFELCIGLLSKQLLTGLLRVGSDIDKLKYLNDVFVKKEDFDKTVQWLIKDVIMNQCLGLYKLKPILIEQCLMQYLNYNKNVVDIIVWQYLLIMDDYKDYHAYKQSEKYQIKCNSALIYEVQQIGYGSHLFDQSLVCCLIPNVEKTRAEYVGIPQETIVECVKPLGTHTMQYCTLIKFDKYEFVSKEFIKDVKLTIKKEKQRQIDQISDGRHRKSIMKETVIEWGRLNPTIDINDININRDLNRLWKCIHRVSIWCQE